MGEISAHEMYQAMLENGVLEDVKKPRVEERITNIESLKIL